MITITDKAAAKLKEFAESEGLALSVRVKVIGSGCAGYSQDLSFDEISSDTDEIFEHNGIKVIVDMLSIQYMDGSEIDYTEREFEAGFVFLNPSVKTSCGCGNSVAF